MATAAGLVWCWVAALGASAQTEVEGLAVSLSPRQTTFAAGPWVLAGADSPLDVRVLYSDATEVWQARVWRELTPDSMEVKPTDTGYSVTIPTFGGLPIEMDIDVQGLWHALGARFDMTLRNGAKGTVVGVRGPGIEGIADRDGGVLYMPNRPGQCLRDPWTALAGAPAQLAYPVPASMQYLTYAGSDGGLALHVEDRSMAYKQFVMGGPEREMTVVQYPFIAPGKRWLAPSVVWQAVSDWHQAAEFYRDGAHYWMVTPRPSPTIRAMPTVPGVVIRARPVEDEFLKDVTKAQEVGTYAAGLAQARGFRDSGMDGAHLVGWFGQGHDSTYPDHQPTEAMGGREGLLQLVDGLHKMDMLAFFYLNARLGNITNQTVIDHPDWRLLPASGEPWIERIGGESFAVLCPASPGYQDYLIAQVLRVAGDYRGDGAQLDQIGAAPSGLCFDATHGHETPATAWAEGETTMLSRLRGELDPVNPSFALWIEGAWEGAGQYVDASQGGFWQDIPGAEPFPQLYRYTFPEHPLFGDSRMGGVPYWCPTDIGRARSINAVASDVFWRGEYHDDTGLSATPSTEVHWFSAWRKVVVTVANTGTEAADYVVALRRDEESLKSASLISAKTLAARQRVDLTVTPETLSFRVTVPAGQVEAVWLEW